MVKKRLGSNLIDNKAYGRLLLWLEDFRKKAIASPEDSPQKSLVLLAMRNIDTLYEFWIFLEILKQISKRSAYVIKTRTTGNNRLDFDYFETSINGRTVRYHFNKQFEPEGSLAWTTASTPDITVTVDGKVVGAFDAKNYETNTENNRTEATRTMLGYMMNLQAPMGALFFPHWSKRFEPKHEEKGVLGFSLPLKASWIQMKPSPDAESEKINSDSLSFLEEQLSEFVALV